MSSQFGDLKTAKGLQALNAHLADKTYLAGHAPTQADAMVFPLLRRSMDRAALPHAFRYYCHLASFTPAQRAKFPKGGANKNKAKAPVQRPPLPNLAKVTRHPLPPNKAPRSVLITSALPYVNNEPHLGNIIGCVLSADVYARYCRLAGYNTLYVCGTDEYGTATETKAFEENTTPQEICNRFHQVHKAIYEWFHIAFDAFGRTSTPFQTNITQGIYRHVDQNQLLIEQESEQLYCPKHDKFLADRFVEGTCPKCGYDDARGDQCDQCGSLLNPTELIRPHYKYDKDAEIVLKKTTHLYLDLPKLEPRLKAWVEAAGAGAWSENTMKVTKTWLRDGLKPRCITRDLRWGTPVPREGYEKKVFYVWFDAPIGYISITAKHCSDVKGAVGAWEEWWHNPDHVSLVQFMGKDNIPFHTVIFPSSLLASGQNWTLLQRISTTEYLNYEDGKFSKSRGLGVFGSHCEQTGIPADVWRYYLLSNRPESSDTEFSWQGFQLCNNSELLANFGNFCLRTLSFTYNFFDAQVPSSAGVRGEKEDKLVKEVNDLLGQYVACMEAQQLREGARLLMSISRLGNQYFQDTQPWELVKEEATRAQAAGVLSVCCQLVRCLALVAYPYMPGISHHLMSQLSLPPLIPEDGTMFTGVPFKLTFEDVPAGTKVCEPYALFDKLESKQVEAMRHKFGGSKGQGESEAAAVEFEPLLRVGRIETATPHPAADKLYLLTVDLGDKGKRNIVSGLKVHYPIDQLPGKLVVVVCNLETAKIKDAPSEGMVLCADKKGMMGLLTVPENVELGAQVSPEGLSPSFKPTLGIKEFKRVAMKSRDGKVVFKDSALRVGADGPFVVAERVGDSVCPIR